LSDTTLQSTPPELPGVAERGRNPFIRSKRGAKVLSRSMLPFFTLRAPKGYGVLSTVGRRSGKTRRTCVHVVRDGDTAYLVMLRLTLQDVDLKHWVAAWMHNVRANPRVKLRLSGHTFEGMARELGDASAIAAARAVYCSGVGAFDYVECAFHRSGLPTRAKIVELHECWFDRGIPLAVRLSA
jgi:deazaflavin-dependent oxidoreductase (nitroreductase family)